MKHLVLFFTILFAISLSAMGGTSAPDHQDWDALLQKYVSSSGVVDYSGFKGDADFQNYLLTLSGSHPDDNWSRSQKMAYWINAYNAFTVKLITDNMPLKSIKDITTPWDKKFIDIEGKKYSLNNIEHDILRPVFKDPRIHFAVNCASKGCPPLLNRAFTAAALDSQLESVTDRFINNPAHNQLSANKASVSKIFEWFADDFKAKGGVVEFIDRYAKVELAPNVGLSYNDYDWSLNGK